MPAAFRISLAFDKVFRPIARLCSSISWAVNPAAPPVDFIRASKRPISTCNCEALLTELANAVAKAVMATPAPRVSGPKVPKPVPKADKRPDTPLSGPFKTDALLAARLKPSPNFLLAPFILLTCFSKRLPLFTALSLAATKPLLSPVMARLRFLFTVCAIFYP